MLSVIDRCKRRSLASPTIHNSSPITHHRSDSTLLCLLPALVPPTDARSVTGVVITAQPSHGEPCMRCWASWGPQLLLLCCPGLVQRQPLSAAHPVSPAGPQSPSQQPSSSSSWGSHTEAGGKGVSSPADNTAGDGPIACCLVLHLASSLLCRLGSLSWTAG